MQYLRSLINENESCPIPDIRKHVSTGGSNKQQQNPVCPSARCQKQLKPWYAQDSSDDENECGNRFSNKKKQYGKSSSHSKPNFFADDNYFEREFFQRHSSGSENDECPAKNSRSVKFSVNKNDFEGDDGCGSGPKKLQSSRQIMVSVKENIVDELLEDRERDELQALLIKKLLKSSSTTRNRAGIIQALVSGQNIPPQVIAKLLAEDCIMDHMSKKIICKLLQDSVNNRHADHIIHDLVLDVSHLSDQNQKIVTRENFIKDNMTVKHVQKLTAPNASKKIVTPECISEFFETLAEAQEVGFGAFVTPRGVKYGPY
ncbi:hypothetical protein HK100_003272, partial [Physocladia obscura]